MGDGGIQNPTITGNYTNTPPQARPDSFETNSPVHFRPANMEVNDLNSLDASVPLLPCSVPLLAMNAKW